MQMVNGLDVLLSEVYGQFVLTFVEYQGATSRLLHGPRILTLCSADLCNVIYSYNFRQYPGPFGCTSWIVVITCTVFLFMRHAGYQD